MIIYKSLLPLLILSTFTNGIPQLVSKLLGTATGTAGPAQDGSASAVDPAQISLQPLGLVPPTSDGRYPAIIYILQGVDPVPIVNELNSLLFGLVSLITSPIFTGCIGSFPQSTLDRITSKFGNQVVVERDQLMSIAGVATEPNADSWALRRICNKEPTASGAYAYPDSAGSGVTVYTVDSGVDSSHPEFSNANVRQELNLVSSEPNTGDLNGHGTHVAGLICGKYYGVAKNVILRAIKVLDKSGGGKLSDMILALNYIAVKSIPILKAVKCIVNMSLTGNKSQILDAVVARSMDFGMAIVAAAGNFNSDACNYSPAGSSGAFAVAATDQTDTKTWFSNYGSCVSIAAPGLSVPSAFIKTASDQGSAPIKLLSGTSMASPIVAGIAALYCGKTQFPDIPTLFAALKRDSQATLQEFSSATPNCFGNTVKLLQTA